MAVLPRSGLVVLPFVVQAVMSRSAATIMVALITVADGRMVPVP